MNGHVHGLRGVKKSQIVFDFLTSDKFMKNTSSIGSLWADWLIIAHFSFSYWWIFYFI